MNRVVKVCLAVCVVFAVLGIILLGVGTILGARPGQYLSLGRVTGWSRLDRLDRLDDVSEKGDIWDSSRGGEYDQTFTEDIRQLEIAIKYGSLEFQTHEGQGIRIKAKNINSDFNCWVENHELHVEDSRQTKWKWKDINRDDWMIVICLPADEFKELEVELEAGVLNAADLQVERISLEMGAGESVIEKLVSKQKAELEVGAGSLTVKRFEGQDLSIDCGTGELEVCVKGAYEDYNYKIEVGIGEVNLGEGHYSGLGYDTRVSNRSNKEMEISCGIGSVSVDFSEED